MNGDLTCARGAGAAICATIAPECDWVRGPLACAKFGVASPVDDPEVVNGDSACARGAGGGVLLIWRPWCGFEGIIVSSRICSLPFLPLALLRNPVGSSQSSCVNLQLLSLKVPFLKNMQFPAAFGGGAEGSMALLGGPSGGPGSLLSGG